MKKTIFNSNSEKDTEKIAKSIAADINGFNVICLYGEMGVGKTTFVRHLAKALGVRTRIISPTYVFIRSHKLGDKTLYHIDAYRIDEKTDDIDSIKEIVERNDSLIIIEWAERIKNILPKERIDIEFIYKEEENARQIEISKQE